MEILHRTYFFVQIERKAHVINNSSPKPRKQKHFQLKIIKNTT